MVRVKICGITNLEDALAAIDSGCDAIGFVFYNKSPRYLTPRKAKEIIKQLPKNIAKVGVFVDAKEKTIKNIAKSCGLDILQFHGNESPGFCKKFKGFRIIKAFRIKGGIDLARVRRYKTFAWMFDAFVESRPGGTGKKFNWDLLRGLGHIRQPVFLSGGLNEKNVEKAIKLIHPAWVDVSSSVELKAGRKDHRKLKRFIKQAKEL